MNPGEAVFLYLPIPYWAAFSVVLYRHDLSRLIQPVRDYGSLRNWWAVLTYLGLTDAGTHRPSRKKEIIPYVIYLSISAGSEPAKWDRSDPRIAFTYGFALKRGGPYPPSG